MKNITAEDKSKTIKEKINDEKIEPLKLPRTISRTSALPNTQIFRANAMYDQRSAYPIATSFVEFKEYVSPKYIFLQ